MARFPDIRLSVVIPARNEEGNIGRTMPRVVAALRQTVGAFEVILIDDCSQDATPRLADELAAQYPEIVVVHNEQNLKQGGSLKRGFALARYEWVTHNAMDYAFDFDDLPDLLQHANEADVIVAERRSYPGTTAPRRFVSLVNRVLLRALFGVPVVDFNFIQIYRRSVIQDLPSFSDATSFITVEKVVRAHSAGLRVVAVPATFHERVVGKPSSATVKNISKALNDMGRLWLELHGLRAKPDSSGPPPVKPQRS
jgi:glycosyltransferase involved in cell wall biosynthesis